jgi:4-diphosphocytidyl-2-C-methyl-D-erythritol kinase
LTVVEIARAKVNLALHILGRRADGYHEIDSLVAFADIGDDLTFEPAPSFELRISGPFAGGLDAGADNLVLRAAHTLWKRWPARIRPARITLNKRLPVAAGLGGGSADAAATLRGVIRLSGAEVPEADLCELALGLGADVPVCLGQRACRMRGIGEKISLLTKFAALPALLVNPGVPIATADVFHKLDLSIGARHSGPIADVAATCTWRNDLEQAATMIAPQIADVLENLRSTPGLRHAAMSGSGATCYGIYADLASAAGAARGLSRNYAAWWIKLVTLN